jgi:hypothetical protein
MANCATGDIELSLKKLQGDDGHRAVVEGLIGLIPTHQSSLAYA